MNKIIDAIKRFFSKLFGSIPGNNTPSTLPSIKDNVRIYTNTTADHKISAVQQTKAGILVMSYHNKTRKNSWVSLLKSDGTLKTLHSSSNETYGTPGLYEGYWMIPAETDKKDPILKVSNTDASIDYGYKAIAEYATRCVDGYIAYGSPVRLCDPSGKIIHQFDESKFNGIVSGMARRGSEWILSIMDGSAPGIASTKGWVMPGAYPEVAVLNNQILAFAKNGKVIVVENGNTVKTIGNSGSKAQRACVYDNFCFWSTADYDQLWVTDGSKIKLLTEYKSGDSSNGTTSGSLFNTSISIQNNTIVYGRSVTNKGYEIYRMVIS